MRKEILITNYRPSKLKEARELSGIEIDFFNSDDSVDTEKLAIYENSEIVTPVDIFLLGYLFNIYEQKAKEKGVKKFLSLTSDILYPHPNGLKYQNFIATHKNYEGMPVNRKKDGTIKWVATITTNEGKERVNFWENKRKELGIEANNILDSGIRQKVAFANHPTKIHVCLFSGTELSIEYKYVSPSKIDMLNKIYDQDLMYYDLDIYETVELLYEVDKCKNFVKIFNIDKSFNDVDELKLILKEFFVEKEYSPFVSPGAMSNSPDRLDGFHSYNNDVRDVCDTGRRKDNLKKYAQDRRVYEMWSDGNWKKADRLYATFVKNGVSPDHIGPMSLGFAHRPKFQPMTASENSAKGNRMTFKDVCILLEDEKQGDIVITWHSKYIWDKLKNKVKNDNDALRLSALMRKNLHHVLIVFSIINENGYGKFLEQFLNPEYSYYDYEFQGFDTVTGNYDKVIEKKLDGKNQQNNVDRYFRIAFEKLVEYANKDNRKNKIWDSEEVDEIIVNLIELIKNNKDTEALELLKKVFIKLSEIAEKNW